MNRALLSVLVILLTACSGGGSPSSDPERAPVSLAPLPIGQAPGGTYDDLATIVVTVRPQWAPGADGQPMTDEFGENPAFLEAPVAVSVTDGPVSADGVDWFQVYVLPDPTRGPTGYFAWVPATQDGAEVLAMEGARECPAPTVDAIATLSPAGRLACFGDQTLALEARSWFAADAVPYAVEPDWLGLPWPRVRSLSLFAPGATEFPRPPDPRIGWLDARVPLDVDLPPLGFTLLVEGQFDHPEARGCRREVDRSGMGFQPPPGSGLPDEPAATSDAWCRGQFVVTSWEIRLGPEGRPPVAGEVQLHRTSFEEAACGGVGMPPLTFRMDPSEADPIWLESEPDGPRIIPIFGMRFAAGFDGELFLSGPNGDIIARNGTPLDPDTKLGPYFVCPMGEIVSITAP